jgi:DNA-binding response OmpR family regulator
VPEAERRQPQPRDRRAASRGGRRDGDRAGFHPIVLVVDADDSVRRICVQGLTRFGFLVDEAKGGMEGAAAVQMMPPRVALVDPVLPSAHTLLSAIRTGQVPMITMTTDFMTTSEEAVDILIKPFSLESMLAAIRRALRAAAGAPPPQIMD